MWGFLVDASGECVAARTLFIGEGMRSIHQAVRTVVLFVVLSIAPAMAQGPAEPAPWGWLELDVELAEEILSEGNLSAAGQLALSTHRALTAAFDSVVSTRGQAYVDQLHDELCRVLLASGFHVPVAPGDGGDGVAHLVSEVATP